jgi:hypothetical protein
MFLQRTRLIAVLATTVNMGNAYDNQDNKVGDVLKQMDMKSSTTRSLDNIFQDVQEGSSSSNQDTAPPVPIQEANDDVSVADQHNTGLVAESGGDVAVASIAILLDCAPTPKPTTNKKGKSVKTATSKPTNSKSSKSKLTLSPTHQPTSQPDNDAITDMTTTHDTAPAPAPIQNVNDVSVNDHDAVLVAESGGSVVALASIPIILGDSSPTPQPTRYKKGKSVKTATTSKPTNSKSSKSKLTISPTHQPTSQPDKAEESMDMTTNHDTAPAPIQEMTNTKVEKEEVIAVPQSDSGVTSYSDSILIASVVVLPKSSKARMSMNQYDGFIGV